MANSHLWSSICAAAAATVVLLPGQLPPDTPAPSVATTCERLFQRVTDGQGVPLQRGERLVSDREGHLRRDLATREVRLHYLVDRQIRGCRVPVVSPVRLEDANRAIGRVLGGEEPRP
jgi:hypothetical protein